MAREREDKRKEVEEQARLERGGLPPEQAAAEARAQTPRRRRTVRAPSSILLTAATEAAMLKQQQIERSQVDNSGAALSSAWKKTKVGTEIDEDTSRKENVGRLHRGKAGGRSRPRSLASSTLAETINVRVGQPLSPLEKHVVGCASRYRIILESAWWQPQSYTV